MSAEGDQTDETRAAADPPELVPPGLSGPPRRVMELGAGVALAYRDAGRGAPVVLLHGFPTSSSLWHEVIRALGPEQRAIAPDLLGFGHSACPLDADFGLEAQAGHIVDLLDRLEVGEATLVGHDWGGAVAQRIAARHPERAARLVLVDSVAFDHPPPPVVRRLAALARLAPLFDAACDTGLLGAFARSRHGMRAGAYRPEALTDAFIDDCLEPLFRETPPAYRDPRDRMRRALLQVVAEAPEPWRTASEALRGFERPTTVLWGCDDPWVSVSYGKRLADAIPGCGGLELLPFTGHWVPLEAPAELAARIVAAPEAAPTAA